MAWIEPHFATDDAPQMPQLELRLAGLPTGLILKAKLEVKYDRPYTDPKPAGDTVQIPSGGGFSEITSDTWKIYDDQDWKLEVGESAGPTGSGDRGFFGGNATLTYRIEGANGSVAAADQEIKFRIAGKNPQDNLCKEYINLKATSQNGAMWFAYAISKHESEAYGGEEFYNQFKKHGGYYQPVKGQEGAPLQVNAEGYGPGGIGIFQVTGKADDPAHVVFREQIWNWQKNVDAGLAIIRYKREEAAPRALNAFKWMRSETRQSNGSYEGQRPQAREQRGQDVPVPNETVRSVTFTDNAGSPPIEDAVNIKLYNGASNGNYCSWDGSANNGQGVWKFNRTRAYDGKSYVDLVLQKLDPSQ